VKTGRDGWSGGYGVDAAVEDREQRLVKPGRGFGLGGHRILSTVLLNRDKGMSADDANWEESALAVNGMEYVWRRLWWKVGWSGFLGRVFVCFLVSVSFLVPFLLLVSFAGWHLLLELILHVTDNGWDLGDTRSRSGRGGGWRKRRTACVTPDGWGGVVVGKWLPPLQSHALSGYVTGLGLSWLSITP